MTENQTTKYETKCELCGGMGETQIMTIEYSSMPSEILLTSKCGECGEKSIQFFDALQPTGKKLTILCDFKTKEDLQRFVYIPEGAKVSFYENGELFYKYEVVITEIMVFEMLLTKIIQKIAEIFQINPTESLVWEPKNVTEVDEEKKKALIIIENIKRIRNCGIMNIKIKDKTGTCRISAKNLETPKDFYKVDIEKLKEDCINYQFME